MTARPMPSNRVLKKSVHPKNILLQAGLFGGGPSDGSGDASETPGEHQASTQRAEPIFANPAHGARAMLDDITKLTFAAPC
jgi:hypothetical protein